MLQIVRQTADMVYALCPFHDDHDPSLTINLTGPFAGRWRCWACGAEGWASEFQMGFTVLQPALYAPQHIGLADSMIPAHDSYDYMVKLAAEWKVPRGSLGEYNMTWTGTSYSAPMRNGFGELIGVHRRFPDGSKRCVKGSRLGLFLPSFYAGGPVVLCEGLSDTVVTASLGFYAIGRASAMSCLDHISVWFSQHCRPGESAVVVSDSNDVGQKSSQRIAEILCRQGFKSSVLSVEPYKDARQMAEDRPDELRKMISQQIGG